MKMTFNVISKEEENVLRMALEFAEQDLNKAHEDGDPDGKADYLRGFAKGLRFAMDTVEHLPEVCQTIIDRAKSEFSL